MAHLTIEGIVAGYGQGDILRGVDLEVASGSIVCVIGPNGAGKSSVLRVVSGLLHPTRGTITLDGQVISGGSPRAVLDHGIVHVPQERSLFPLMSVWDNPAAGGLRAAGTGRRPAKGRRSGRALPPRTRALSGTSRIALRR